MSNSPEAQFSGIELAMLRMLQESGAPQQVTLTTASFANGIIPSAGRLSGGHSLPLHWPVPPLQYCNSVLQRQCLKLYVTFSLVVFLFCLLFTFTFYNCIVPVGFLP